MTNFFQASPLDIVESYLGNHFIPNERIDNLTIRVPAYGGQDESVELLLRWDPNDKVLIIRADGGIKVSAQQSAEVLSYLNEINAGMLTFAFFIDSQRSTIQCRWAHIVTEAIFTEYVIESLIDDVHECFLYFALPALAITEDGGTSIDALNELKEGQDPDGDTSSVDSVN